MSSKICSDCKLNVDNLVKLPFGKLVCETCIEIQCTENIQEFHLTLSQLDSLSNKFKVNFTSDEDNLGVKLYKIKQDLHDFFTNMNQFETIINKRIDEIKLEININFDFCQNEINKSQQYNHQEIEKFQRDLLAKANKSKENNKFQVLEHLYIQYAAYLNKLSKNINDLNQFNDSSAQTATAIIHQLEENEKELDSFEKFISQQTVLLNQSYFSNKMLNFSKRKTHFSQNALQLGYLHIAEKNEEEFVQFGPYLKNFFSMTSKPTNTTGRQSTQKIHSIHTINQFESECVVMAIKSVQDYQIRVYNIKHGNLKYERSFANRTVFMLNSNTSHLILCHSSDLLININNFVLELYDKQLNLISHCKKFVLNSMPIDIFIDQHIYILSIMKENNMPTITVLDYDLNECNSFIISNIEISRNSSASDTFKIFTIENTLFLKQNHLFGTRLNLIETENGNCFKKIELNFILQNQNFTIDKSFKMIALSANELKFLIFDLNTQKMLYKTSFQCTKQTFNSFCLTRDGNILILENPLG